MNKHLDEPDSLRADAEAQLVNTPATNELPRPVEELLHELQVNQIELEMQNENLRRTQVIIEEMRDRYVDLYELDHVG